MAYKMKQLNITNTLSTETIANHIGKSEFDESFNLELETSTPFKNSTHNVD